MAELSALCARDSHCRSATTIRNEISSPQIDLVAAISFLL